MKTAIIAEDLKASLEREQSFFSRTGIRTIGAVSE